MNILFLTSNNLATNPRLYKELCLADTQKHSVSYIQFKLGNWSDAKTEGLKSGLTTSRSMDTRRRGFVKEDSIDATRNAFLFWIYWAVLERISRIIYPITKRSLFVNALAQSRRSLQIYKKAKSGRGKPELIIAHNLSALYPAFKLSKKWKVPFIFDIEDYYPGEQIRKGAKHEKSRREFLMKELLPQAAALTSASPLIKEYSDKLTGNHPCHPVILNSFPWSEFAEPENRDIAHQRSETLNLVWFSQKISKGRGLEQFFDALIILKSSIPEISHSLHLTLIGDLDPAFKSTILDPFISSHRAPNILPPMSQSDLHNSLAKFDVGLAVEPGKDLNNTLALSNKILAYSQSGLYIFATNTPAQEQFINEDRDRGILSGLSPGEMAVAIRSVWEKKEDLRKNREKRYYSVKELAWENESQKLIKLWNQVLIEKT